MNSFDYMVFSLLNGKDDTETTHKTFVNDVTRKYKHRSKDGKVVTIKTKK